MVSIYYGIGRVMILETALINGKRASECGRDCKPERYL